MRRLVMAIAIGILVWYSLPQNTPKPDVSKPVAKDDKSVLVTKVVDGDTIEIETGQKVRLIGVNTPETVDPRRPVQCFGKEASDFTKSQLTNQRVYLVKDVSETDKYGRLLRFVYLDDPEATSEARMFNEILVRQGYADVSTYPPDVKYAERFKLAASEARKDLVGLWKECNSAR